MTDNDRSGPDTPTPPLGQPAQPPPYVPATGEPPAQPAAAGRWPEHQQAGVTQPRPPTLAEQRARAAGRARAAARRDRGHRAQAPRPRKRLLVGGGVTVGVVALVAIWYAVTSPDNVTAQCIDQNDVVVDDDYCGDSYYRSHGGYSSGGFIYIGGSSYRYNYGGTGSDRPEGQRWQLHRSPRAPTSSRSPARPSSAAASAWAAAARAGAAECVASPRSRGRTGSARSRTRGLSSARPRRALDGSSARTGTSRCTTSST